MLDLLLIAFAAVTCGRVCGHKDLSPVIGIVIAVLFTVVGCIIGLAATRPFDTVGTINNAFGGIVIGGIAAFLLCAMLPRGPSEPPSPSDTAGPYQGPSTG